MTRTLIRVVSGFVGSIALPFPTLLIVAVALIVGYFSAKTQHESNMQKTYQRKLLALITQGNGECGGICRGFHKLVCCSN